MINSRRPNCFVYEGIYEVLSSDGLKHKYTSESKGVRIIDFQLFDGFRERQGFTQASHLHPTESLDRKRPSFSEQICPLSYN
jgi:hypothetical protein